MINITENQYTHLQQVMAHDYSKVTSRKNVYDKTQIQYNKDIGMQQFFKIDLSNVKS